MTRKRDLREPPPPGSPDARPSRRSTKPPGRLARAHETGPRGDRPHAKGDGDCVRIYGFHSVQSALQAPRRALVRLYATAAAAERLKDAIAARGLETRVVSVEEMARLSPRDAAHQGVLLEARPLPPIDLSELPPDGLAVVLDQITDPHNVGAILRTAAAFAVDALVATERHSPEFSGALAKSASGGLEHVPVASVVNLAQALAEMGDMGYLRVGLDSEAPIALDAVPLAKPLALVLGAEGKGLRRLTRERCDVLARLDLPGAIKSLNVSNAAAIALSLIDRRLRGTQRPDVATPGA
jgi:23S rRNA (guanosine2251-2'-O)-methyltransferase